MTVAELRAALAGMPDDAVVYVRSDYGKQSQQARMVLSSLSSQGPLPHYGDELEWWTEPSGGITAALIMS